MKIKDVVFVYQMHEERDLRWHGRYHNHGSREYELHYFLEGVGAFYTHKQSYVIKEGSLFLSRPFDKHSIKATDLTHMITYYAVLVELEQGEQELEDLLERGIKKDHFYNIGSNFRFFFEEIKEKSLSGNSNLSLSAVHQFISFLYILAEDMKSFDHGSGSNVHIEKALRIMQHNVSENLQLSDITQKLNLDISYFIRLFRKKMKITPMKYFGRLKLEAATSLLMSTDLPVYRIADRLKFYSEFHFSKVFKQHTGLSPMHYRTQYRQYLGNGFEIQ